MEILTPIVSYREGRKLSIGEIMEEGKGSSREWDGGEIRREVC